MKSSALVALLNIPESTIRKYAGDYAAYLSPAVNAGAGRHRDYTDHDARVLKLVIDMKAAKQRPEDIEVTLQSLQAGGWERLPALDENTLAIIPTPQALIVAQTERAVMQKEIDMLREALDKATSDRDELMRRLARAEMRAELFESGELKPRGT
jgi:DNA-binding transcriptional MerR regulator